MSFKNKVVWITGASSGIGRELAVQLKKAGAKLILSSRKREKLYELKQSLKTDLINTHILPLDLEDKANLASKAAEAIKIYGKIDFLFNCGGISQRSLGLDTLPEIEEKIFDTNYWGTVLLSKYVIPQMIENGGGSIVVISSVVGKFGTMFRTSYSASKHALHGYFESLRYEVEDKGIQISIVCPGFINTEITKNSVMGNGTLYDKMDQNQLNGIPVQECVQKILTAVKKGKKEIIIARKEKWAVLLKRLSPSYLHKVLKKRAVV
ncbi:SDR family oxidoreductase [Pseudopedobacter beijingensis]|uniref:SDR family oxidoreductase n=1 Tax=Pseudopedobacter beijingensis TaxID=1207056 RepID=A0ABW4I9S1_9SPHI